MSSATLNRDLRLYRQLSRLPRPSSYTGKIFLVAFLGTHIPLLGAVGYVTLSHLPMAQALPVLKAVLAATLIGTAGTLWALYRLLAPIRCTADALQEYVDSSTAPNLPTTFSDRAGQLMRNTQRTITKLDTLLRFKNRMLGVVSHDARGPASAVLMAVDAIEKQLDAPAPNLDYVRSLTQQMEHTVEYQLDLFHSMLNVARYGEGQVTLNPDTGTAQSVFERVRGNLKILAAKRNHDLQLDLDAPELMLHTDIGKLEQVLNNLGSNALKYTPEGGTVTLGMTTSSEEDTVSFWVEDTGPGIPESVRGELFEAYNADADPDTDSVGLGLWICKTFTEVLGGTIALKSTDDGSTFTVRFDRAAIEAAPESA